ncbi:hypothetical protein BDZ97DRAFT_2000399 [Flammula alnicola]|nr:hypothetical protein BDZ97DRAFT_2000399 [Flammula alnicola]
MHVCMEVGRSASTGSWRKEREKRDRLQSHLPALWMDMDNSGREDAEKKRLRDPKAFTDPYQAKARNHTTRSQTDLSTAKKNARRQRDDAYLAKQPISRAQSTAQQGTTTMATERIETGKRDAEPKDKPTWAWWNDCRVSVLQDLMGNVITRWCRA